MEVRRAVLQGAEKVLKKYGKALGVDLNRSEPMTKLQYYIERDMMGFGPLNIVFVDDRIEDISCNGVNVPVYVYHRDFESMPTNVVFTTRKALDDYIIHLVHKANKHISSAFPIVDAMIYGKHRLAATFREGGLSEGKHLHRQEVQGEALHHHRADTGQRHQQPPDGLSLGPDREQG
jgi:flagellar protein FlaI